MSWINGQVRVAVRGIEDSPLVGELAFVGRMGVLLNILTDGALIPRAFFLPWEGVIWISPVVPGDET